MTTLSKKQIKFLKKTAHKLKAIFQMGKLGLTEVFIEQVDQALEKREMIKFTVLQNSEEDVRDVADEIASAIDATVVQVIGHTAILYRPSSKEKFQVLSKEVSQIRS